MHSAQLQVTGYRLSRLLVYYLLVTITPNVPIAEVGVRGAWAIVVFGSMNAAFAGVLLWVINTLLPCLGLFYEKIKIKFAIMVLQKENVKNFAKFCKIFRNITL